MGLVSKGLVFKHSTNTANTELPLKVTMLLFLSSARGLFSHVQTPHKPPSHPGGRPRDPKVRFHVAPGRARFTRHATRLTLDTEKREGNPGTKGERKERGSSAHRPGAAHLFPLLSRSIALPITLDFLSSSCTSSSSVFLHVCLALCHKEETRRT